MLNATWGLKLYICMHVKLLLFLTIAIPYGILHLAVIDRKEASALETSNQHVE